DILLIGENTDAVLAKYGNKDHQSILLIVEYPSGEKATEASTSFIDNYLPDLQGNRTLKLEDGMYSGIEQKENILVLVFNAESGKDAEKLIDDVLKILP
ncbi:MAG: hypothetical protein KAT15_01145, partial [Bacteroidales bacterium]|nr:hypothetical protein [Bacteroidales bacterium]